MKWIGAAICLALSPMWLRAQNADEIIGEIATELEEEGLLDEAAGEELAEMGAIADEPLDLNSVTSEELGQLIFLSERQARAIVRHRAAVGRIASEQELMSIGCLSASDIYRLRQFAYIGEGMDTFGIAKRVDAELLGRAGRRWPTSRGLSAKDSSAAYPGPAWSQLIRFKGEVGKKVSVGIVGQNDAGEPQLQNGAGLMDFGGGYICVEPKRGIVTRAVVGNYHVRLGQGLGAWTGFSLSPTASGLSVGRSAMGVTPTMSAAESGYRRGAGIMLRHKRFRATLWGSSTRDDGTIMTRDDGSTYVSAIKADGLHRTATERARRHNIRIASGGVYASGDMGVLRVGAGYNIWHISTPLGSERIYQANRPEGRDIGTASVDVNWFARKAHIFGEAVAQGRNAWGAVAGMEIDAGGGTSFCASIRRFGRRYYTANGRPATHSSTAAGEGGASFGVTFQPLGFMCVGGVVDYWKNHWLRYGALSPTSGWKSRVVVDIYPDRRSSIRISIRHTEQEKTRGTESAKGRIEPSNSTRYKVQYDMAAVGAIGLTTDAEMAVAEGYDGGKGYMVSEGVKVSAMGDKLRLQAIATYFDTDNYASRVYGREPRMAYDMRFASYYGEGIAASGMVTVGPIGGFRVWAWASLLWQNGRETLGSGNDETPGPCRCDVRLQLQWKLFWMKRKDYFAVGRK